MKTLMSKVLLALCLASGAGLVAADDDRFDARGFAAGSAMQWRLGDFRGARGYEIFYRAPDDRRWHRAPGGATDLADGWVLGTDRHRGGYGIYQWNGRGWSRMPGTAVEIGGSYQRPWVVNDRGIRYVWNGYDWREAAFDRDDRRDRDDWRGRRGRDERDDRRGRDDR